MCTTTQEIHKFEKAGLGVAPFRVVGMDEKVTVSYPGATPQPAGSCDYCCAGIRYRFHIRGADGRTFVVGSDCVAKVGDAGLAKVVDRKLAEVKREAKAARDAARIGAAQQLLAQPAVLAVLAAQPHPQTWAAAQGRTMADNVAWLLDHAGTTGKLAAARIIEAAAGK